MESIGTWWMWTAFAVFVLVALAVDLLVLQQKGSQKVSAREALWWSLIWVTLAFIFNAALWYWLNLEHGRQFANLKATEFLTGYVLEKALAVDNIFVFLMLFTYFAVPPELQRRALIYGVVGAIVLRGGMILGGAWLISEFHWVLYLFGLFLLVTGIKMMLAAGQKPDLAGNPLLGWIRSRVRMTPRFEGERLFVTVDGVRFATPLFVVMVMIGVTDVVFAVDSIPAIFAITTDPFIVLTSNVFAILGLRALYFLLADMADRFHLLTYGLALVLMFVGVKMLAVDFYKIPVLLSLGVVAAIIGGSIAASLLSKPQPRAE